MDAGQTDSDGLTCQVFKPCIAVPSAASYTSHPRLHTPIPLAALKPFDPPHASIHRCSSAPPRGCLCLCQQGVGRSMDSRLMLDNKHISHFCMNAVCYQSSCPGCQVTSTNVLDLGGLHALFSQTPVPDPSTACTQGRAGYIRSGAEICVSCPFCPSSAMQFFMTLRNLPP